MPALSADELVHVLAEIEPTLVGAQIEDAALLEGRDDLLLFLAAGQPPGRRALHVAPGGARARVCFTRRRFPRAAFATGPRVDRLVQLLSGTRCGGVRPAPGERRFSMSWLREGAPEVRLEVELFGNRGLWCLTDDRARILSMSRLPGGARKELRPGARYVPPTPRPAPTRPDPPRSVPAEPSAAAETPTSGTPAAEARTARRAAAPPTPRFGPPWSEAIDAHFTALDREQEREARRGALTRAAERAVRRLRARLAGLERQLDAVRGADELRTAADMLMAYGPQLGAGARELRVPHPLRQDEEIVVALDPRKPPHAQAADLYAKARRYRQGGADAERQVRAARAQLRALEGELELLAGAGVPRAGSGAEGEGERPDGRGRQGDRDQGDRDQGDRDRQDDGGRQGASVRILEACAARLLGLGVQVPGPGRSAAEAHRSGTTRGPGHPGGTAASLAERKLAKITRGERFRCFESKEGYLILVGRSNQQNDRLTMSVARGNDLWFHVGGGYAGSHVVLRLPKGKTASLESLLDAATLAVYFSKLRGADRADVIYTQRKHVRKPRGAPPGRVTPAHTKTLTLRAERARLTRLLSGAPDSGNSGAPDSGGPGPGVPGRGEPGARAADPRLGGGPGCSPSPRHGH